LEAYIKVSVFHIVLFGARMKKSKMASECEEEIVILRR